MELHLQKEPFSWHAIIRDQHLTVRVEYEEDFIVYTARPLKPAAGRIWIYPMVFNDKQVVLKNASIDMRFKYGIWGYHYL